MWWTQTPLGRLTHRGLMKCSGQRRSRKGVRNVKGRALSILAGEQGSCSGEEAERRLAGA